MHSYVRRTRDTVPHPTDALPAHHMHAALELTGCCKHLKADINLAEWRVCAWLGALACTQARGTAGSSADERLSLRYAATGRHSDSALRA